MAEPDGRDRQVDWFYRHLRARPTSTTCPPISPPYWGKYVFHDNNRDGIQRKLALTRATQDAFLRWHPMVMHDLHESIPLLSIWTGTGPYNRPRPHRHQRVARDRLPRGHDADRARDAGGVDVGLRRGLGARLRGIGGHQPQRHRPRLRDLRQRHRARPWSATSTRRKRYTGSRSPRRSGTAPCRRRRSSRGRCATTSTTCRPACSRRLQYTALHRGELLESFWVKGNRALEKGRNPLNGVQSVCPEIKAANEARYSTRCHIDLANGI